MTKTKRFYIECPYAEKDKAKELGAKWDIDERKWYIPQDIDRNLFKKWWPQEVAAGKDMFPG